MPCRRCLGVDPTRRPRERTLDSSSTEIPCAEPDPKWHMPTPAPLSVKTSCALWVGVACRVGCVMGDLQYDGSAGQKCRYRGGEGRRASRCLRSYKPSWTAVSLLHASRRSQFGGEGCSTRDCGQHDNPVFFPAILAAGGIGFLRSQAATSLGHNPTPTSLSPLDRGAHFSNV